MYYLHRVGAVIQAKETAMTALPMVFELRLYQVAPGRMPDVHGRFQHHLPKLFERHAIDVVGRWTAVAGPDAPLFVYLMAYADLAQRERAWAGFYGDEEWLRIRAQTNAGSEMVERYTLMFLRASASWQLDRNDTKRSIGDVHELLLQRIAIGQKAATDAYLRDIYLPAVERAGGRLMMVAEIISGADLPQYAMMFAWSDPQAQHLGRLAVEGDAQVLDATGRQRAQTGRTLLDRADVLVLEPGR